MKVGNSVRKYVAPIDCYTWVKEVRSKDRIPVWVTYLGEDEEMKYYTTDYLGGYLWGVIKEVEE